MKVKGAKESSRATGEVWAHDTLRSTAAQASAARRNPPRYAKTSAECTSAQRTPLTTRPATPTAVNTTRPRGVRACQSCSSPLRRRAAQRRRPMASVAPTNTDCAWVSVPK